LTEQSIVNNVYTTSTYVFGRALNSARTHHFVIDGTNEPKEELTPVEVFLSAVSSCGVQQVERYAREEGIPVSRVEARIEGARAAEDPTVFQRVSMQMDVYGATQQQAEALVAKFQSKCPLYRTVSHSVDVDMQVISHP
jgi:uncharacterized OsmC-like protein